MAIITVADLKAMPGIDTGSYTNAQLTRAIAQAQSIIESYCDRTFDSTTRNDWFDVAGGQYLRLRQWPIEFVWRLSTRRGNVLSITLGTASRMLVTVQLNMMTIQTDLGDGSMDLTAKGTMTELVTAIASNLSGKVTASVVEETQQWSLRPGVWGASEVQGSTIYLEGPLDDDVAYITQPETGMLYKPEGWPHGPGAVYVDYDAGYLTYPYDLQMVCAQVAMDSMAMQTGNITSEKIGNVTYNYGTAGIYGLLAGHESVLNKYRRLM